MLTIWVSGWNKCVQLKIWNANFKISDFNIIDFSQMLTETLNVT